MKLAWLLRLLLLGLGLTAAAWGWFWATLGLAWLGLIGAVAIAGTHAALMALEFLWLRALNRGDPAPAPTAAELLRAWAAEAAGAVLVFGWRQPFRSRRFADTDQPPAPGRRGLVLVHGFVCNRGLWNGWWPALRAAGVPVVAVDLEPVFGSIDDYAPGIEAAVRRLEQATGRPPLLVGHSMGGLAIRAWLRASGGDARIAGAITIGSPHHGTWLARFALQRNAQQMRLGSPWLRSLRAAEPAARAARFTCFYSHCDNIVFPSSTATLPGADNRHLHGQAHVHLLQHPAVLAEVLRRVTPPAPDGAGDPGEPAGRPAPAHRRTPQAGRHRRPGRRPGRSFFRRCAAEEPAPTAPAAQLPWAPSSPTPTESRSMQVQFESRDPDGRRLRDVAVQRLRFVLRRLAWLVPRARVWLDDVNGPGGGIDKRCRVELKTDTHGTVVVTSIARDWRTAIDSAFRRAARAVVQSWRRRRGPRRERPLALRHQG